MAMDKKSIYQNQSIQNGLEKFLDQQMLGTNVVGGKGTREAERPQKQLKTEFATPVRMSDEQESEYGQNAGRSRGQEPSAKRNGAHTYEREFSGSTVESDRPQNAASKIGETSGKKRTGGKDATQKRAEESYAKGGAAHKDSRGGSKRGDDSGKNSRGDSKKGDDTDRNKRSKEKRGKEQKKGSKWKKVLVIILIVLAALILWWYFMVGRVYNKMNYEKADDIIEGSMKEDGVINVLLIGNDSRENGEDGRSDAMILISISSKTKKVYMTSLLRDMYVEIPGHGGNRLNAAYAYGGAALLCETIEQNFGIEVNRYALVNFQAFANMVDAVGGVDLELTNEEVQWVNAYLNEYNLLEGREITTDYLDTSLSGMLHLNGPQALAYCRNRYIGTDFGRTERQRKVLGAVMKKLPLAMAANSSDLIDGLFPYLTTNLTQAEVYQLTLNAAKYLSYDVEQMTIPAEGTYSNATIRQMMVLQVDFDANKKLLRENLYGEGEEAEE